MFKFFQKDAIIAFYDKYNKYFTNPTLIILLSFLCILPFLIFAFYSHPSAEDDFHICVQVYQSDFWQAQAHWFNSWQGRFFATAVNSLSPWCFDSLFGYQFFNFIQLCLFCSAICFFIDELTLKQLSDKWSLALAGIFLIIYFYLAPELNLWYWYVGSTTYLLPVILMFVHWALVFRLNNISQKTNKILLIIAISLLIIAVCGSQESIMLLLTTLWFLILIYRLIDEKKFSWLTFYFFVLCIICLLIVMNAPGTKNRAGYYTENKLFFKSAIFAGINLLKMAKQWLSNSLILPMTLFFIPFSYKIQEKLEKTPFILGLNPIFSVFIWLLCLFIPPFTVLYGLGGTDIPERTQNVMYIYFVMGWFLNVYILTSFLHQKWQIKAPTLPLFANILLILMLSLALIKDNNIRLAYTELLNGTAVTYDEQLVNRYEEIKQSKQDTVYVDSLYAVPTTIYTKDIISWLANPYGQYFGKKAVKIKKRGQKNDKN